jgi:predicted peptidase
MGRLGTAGSAHLPESNMMKIIGPIAAFLLISSAGFADTGFLDRSLAFQGESYSYQVYVPANYTPESMWPVITDLHGNGRQGNDGMQPTRSSLADLIREDRSLFPAIVLFPQARVGTRWMFPAMEELVVAELEQTISEFHGDSKRLYLTGFSMGAVGVYRIAYRWPDKFAALVCIAGRVEEGKDYSPQEVEIDRRTNPFVIAPDPFAALALRIRKLPIWIFHGDQDQTSPVEPSRQLTAALKSAGADVRYTEYPGAGHVPAAAKAYADRNMISWLLKQHR